MEAKFLTLPLFHVVGFAVEASVEAFEAGLGKEIYQSLVDRKDEIHNKKNENVTLMQIYPMDPDFNPQVDRFTHLICYEVNELGEVPQHMISHTVTESKYVAFTHKGLESELSRTYEYLYRQWIPDSGNEPKDYDFEIWDERYHPESPDNEIDVYVALK